MLRLLHLDHGRLLPVEGKGRRCLILPNDQLVLVGFAYGETTLALKAFSGQIVYTLTLKLLSRFDAKGSLGLLRVRSHTKLGRIFILLDFICLFVLVGYRFLFLFIKSLFSLWLRYAVLRWVFVDLGG